MNAETLNSSNLKSLDSAAIQKTTEKEFDSLRREKKFIDVTPIKKPERPEAAPKKIDEKVGEYINNPEFVLNKLVFEGNDLYSNDFLQKFSTDFINKSVTMDDILYLTTAISRFYQANGYLTSYAFIPPQEVLNGEIKIHIVESKIDNIIMQGNKWTKNRYLQNGVLASNGIQQNKVFDAKKLQLALRELNTQDYLKAQVQVTKNKNDDTELILNVKDRVPVGFDVFWDNYGRELTGRQRANLILSYDNLTGFGDKIYGGAILA